MSKHKYPLGSLLLAKNGDLGYIRSHSFSMDFTGRSTYSIYWFMDQVISGDVWEIDVGNFVKIYKDKYGE
mgnify:FL=1